MEERKAAAAVKSRCNPTPIKGDDEGTRVREREVNRHHLKLHHGDSHGWPQARQITSRNLAVLPVLIRFQIMRCRGYDAIWMPDLRHRDHPHRQIGRNVWVGRGKYQFKF